MLRSGDSLWLQKVPVVAAEVLPFADELPF
jgi:hypothetical protein